MQNTLLNHLASKFNQITDAGLLKPERVLNTPQQNHIGVKGSQRPVINLCANNYLALANETEVIAAAKGALDRWGYGLASARLICGTQTIHKDLEREISAFLGTEDTILYPSCFDANTGLFETLLNSEDAVISDELNHASIIDVCACAERNVIVIATAICRIWRKNSKKLKVRGTGSSPQMVFSPWMATLRSFRRFVILRTNTTLR